MDDLERRIARLEAQIGSLIRVSPLARVSSTGQGDQVQAAPQDGSDTPAYTAQRFQHAGFKSTPVVDGNGRGVTMFVRGGATNGAIVAEDDGYDPGLAAGEAVIYSPTKHACRIYFDKNGVLHIDAETGQDVIVNGGSAAVGRVGDSVSVTVGINALTLAVSGASAQGPAAPVTLTGTITAGAAHVKA